MHVPDSLMKSLHPTPKKSSHLSMSSINENIWVLKQKCCKLVQLWQSVKLTVHLELLRSLLKTFNAEFINSRAVYFATCTEFLSFFSHKASGIRSCICPSDSPLSVEKPCAVSFYSFKVISTFII